MPIQYISIGSAGMGIFSYLGLIHTLACISPELFDDIKGCIGCSAGSYISLLIALGLQKDSKTLNEIFVLFKKNVLISNNKLLTVGMYANEFGKNISCELGQLVEHTLEKRGFSSKISLGDLQQHLKLRLAFVSADIKCGKTIILDANTHYNIPVTLAIQMSSAVPFLNPPIKYNKILAIDGAVLQQLNMDYFPKEETAFIYCVQTPSRMEENFDIIRYSAYIIQCLQQQHDNLTDAIMEGFPHIKMVADNIFKFVDQPCTLLTHKLDKLFVAGCIETLKNFMPEVFTLLGLFIINLSQTQDLECH